jgi:hypothetical protein
VTLLYYQCGNVSNLWYLTGSTYSWQANDDYFMTDVTVAAQGFNNDLAQSENDTYTWVGDVEGTVLLLHDASASLRVYWSVPDGVANSSLEFKYGTSEITPIYIFTVCLFVTILFD